MPKRTDLRKVMVIGSGPIVIGQAAEFDYAGTQACQALREEGVEVVLVNSNPATIMTDLDIADRVYVEPLTLSFVTSVLVRERPDGLVATLGGQMGLNLARELSRAGVLADLGVELLGTPLSGIEKAEDRELFRRTMLDLGEPIAASRTVTTVEDALRFADEVGYPVVLRPAYTLGGTGGGFAHNPDELRVAAERALSISPIHQTLVEESIAGWKEIEYEVMRDARGTAIVVCNMENLDPVGVHTGDSIVVAPSQTLSDDEYQRLREASLRIVEALDVRGGCNVQLALHPTTGAYRVIEVNPRVSRSSALASKATGYPIARVAAKIALGLELHEIVNPVTGRTTAAFEPSIDYVVVKIPRWPFDKFPDAQRELGTQMKSTGEVMAIDRTFPGALQKAVRSLDIRRDGLVSPEEEAAATEDLWRHVDRPTDRRLFCIAELLRRGATVEEVARRTAIDPWFLRSIAAIVDWEDRLRRDPDLLGREMRTLKQWGFSDARLARLVGSTPDAVRARRRALGVLPTYKIVDTCAGEFEASTPYYYSTYEDENEAAPLPARRKVLVLGSGPIRIGQGIEFDCCSVYALRALRRQDVAAIIINNNPETVSTDFNASNRLYFEPLTLEDVLNVVDLEQPDGVVVQFGGQTAINLAAELERHGVRILGTPVAGMDAAEDREQFDRLLESLGIRRPPGGTALGVEEALAVAERIGYPVLVRPSYVLGGRAMRIVDDAEELARYVAEARDVGPGRPILIDRYVNGLELEVDAVADGETVVIPAVLEHVERAGIHSGDSVAVLPPVQASPDVVAQVVDITERLTRGLGVVGHINIQLVARDGEVYVIEANPRASRTVPFVTKATGVPLVPLAMAAILGTRLRDLGWRSGLVPPPPAYAIKMPVFSFGKMIRVDAALGPEMKSTGEVMGVDWRYEAALYKAFLAAGFRLPPGGRILATIADADKAEAIPLLAELAAMGFRLAATRGTLAALAQYGVAADPVARLSEGRPHLVDQIRSGAFDLVVDTITRGGRPESEGFYIRRAAVESGVLCFTSVDTLRAAVEGLKSRSVAPFTVRSLNEWRQDDAHVATLP
ncbi:MAG: carbamoyl-phosphate synthase large subunit [Actinomycetia bacterium]|nr:carbamoyl-phosphate synthase large subunit [Actinomycetes bacterium]